MKRFRFCLESVLSLRAVAERSARERFGAAQRRAAAALEVLNGAEVRRAALADSLAQARAGTFRPADQSGALVALQAADALVRDAAKACAEATSAAARAREEWLAARRRLQVVERLRERALVAHREAAEKAEQALLDELASIAAARVAISTP